MDSDVELSPPTIISVLDHGAFVAKHVPYLGHVVKESKVFHWKVDGWGKHGKKQLSPEFSCGGHKWRISLFPFGLPGTTQNEVISVYLDRAGANLSEGWHACAKFALVISNLHDPTIYTVSTAHHRFTSRECDWGFTRFAKLHKLYQRQAGHNRPTIEDGSAVISVYVRVLEDPTGVLWHNFVDYDSKKETGFVGLKNQGTTGCMNAVLQCLFYTNHFRKAIYQIPTEDQDPTESVPLALQRVFYNLQTSNQPVDTSELTESLGWKSGESLLQQDVQEFNRVLQDKLESSMKGTRAEGAISKLFTGKMKSFIKCINVDYESSRIEEFNDIELNVKGIKTLYDSFRDYTAVKVLDGKFKYQTEGFGPQDARNGIIFQSFPPVLHLLLKRTPSSIGYGFGSKLAPKIDDPFKFPFEINLGDFLDETADRTESWKYRLHGVVVHSGDLHGGQHFALIKPDRHARWLKFDNDRVTPVTDREVLEENHGGEPLGDVVIQTQRDRVEAMRKFTRARMLVYIRETAIDEVLAPLTQEDITPDLRRRLDEERAQIEEPRMFLTAKVITDENFSRHEGFDLASFDGRNSPPSDFQTFIVFKQMKYRVFKSRVAKRYGYSESQFRLWGLANRKNKTVRPDLHVPEDEPSLTVEVIRENLAIQPGDLLLYLEMLPDPSKEIQLDDGGMIMVFLKHFDTAMQTLFGVCKIWVPEADKVGSLIPIINEKMKWTSETPLKLYEEIKPGMIQPTWPGHTFTQSEIQSGDIICFQAETSDQETHDLESQGLCSNPVQFYNFLLNRVMVSFRPRLGEPSTDQPEFSLALSKKQKYDAMAARVGERLNHEPTELRFTTTHTTGGKAKTVAKHRLNPSTLNIAFPSITPSITVILYEKLDVIVIEPQAERSLNVIWTGIHNTERSIHPLSLSKTSTVHDLIGELSKQVQLTPTGRIRVLGVTNDGKTLNEFVGSKTIGDIPDPVELFAQEVPPEE